jgi:hypothetical protein
VYGSRYGAEYSIDQLSRFIDPGVRERMTRVAAYPAQEVAAGGTERAAADAMQRLVDLRALLRGRFGG